MPAAKGTRDKTFAVNATDSVHVYSRNGETWLQLRRSVPTLENIAGPSFKTALSLAPDDAIAIAAELLAAAIRQKAAPTRATDGPKTNASAKPSAKGAAVTAVKAKTANEGRIWTKTEEEELVKDMTPELRSSR